MILLLKNKIHFFFQEEPKSIMELLRQLVFQNRHGDQIGETLLHFACSARYAEHLNLASIHLLLEAGAVPNAGNKDRNGPLHVLAIWHNNGNDVKTKSVARLLLQKGAHLHMVNKKRETPADVWIKFNKKKKVLPEVEISLPEWLREPERIPMLTCLCARVIRPFLFAYKKGEDLPATLGDFIEWH